MMRSPFFPELPTLAEQGIQGAEPAALDQVAFRKLLGEEGRVLATLIKSRKIALD